MIEKVTYRLLPNTSQRFLVTEDNITYEFRFKLGAEYITCDCIRDSRTLFLGKQLILGQLIDNFFIMDTESLEEDPIPQGFGTRWTFVYFRGL